MKDFDLTTLPSQANRHILITGGTTGLGRQMVQVLAAQDPALIVFTGRNRVRAEQLIESLRNAHPNVRVDFSQMDLSSLDDVRSSAVDSLTAALDGRLDVLVCNAGIMATGPALSADGYEMQWVTNYLGHALLVKLFLPCLSATAARYGDARVVTLTSEGMMLAPSGGIVFDELKTKQEYGFGARWKRYGQSKLGNVLFAAQLAKHYPALTSVAIHPGVVGTDLVKSLGLADRLLVYATSTVIKPEDGCKNSLWGATADRKSFQNGAYYGPIAEPGKRTKWSHDEKLAERLWKWTEEVLRPYAANK